MRAVDIITKKRDGETLSREEIDFFIRGFTGGEIPDYQAAAWAMAVLLRGMSGEETANLTMAMANSGDTLDLSSVVRIAVDKHSTGGVGDKTTLVVEPMVAACGVPVGKMSGRGLGFTGGTLDKMESIPGYDVNLTTTEFLAQLADVGLVLCGQTADLAPADGKMYALRDVTGTVPSTPLIASSVMSKKIAAGAQAIVLDVKVGLGAFMHAIDDAIELAETMVEIGCRAGRDVVALISDMNQPLGCAVGNALEVREAIDTLRGGGPEDFREHCLVVAGHMLVLGGAYDTLEEARQAAETSLIDGSALDKFKQLVIAQHGDPGVVEHPEKLPSAPIIRTVEAPLSGYLARIHAMEVGLTSVVLGAGRSKKGDPVDHAVGIEILYKVGGAVKQGNPLFIVHAHDESSFSTAASRLLAAHEIVRDPVPTLPLFYKTITARDLDC
ncbi:MAG: thymidine phosphorylase [Anaerolineales bacterium]|nr:thymidine phosphorylase [Anaerolineales bacterium]